MLPPNDRAGPKRSEALGEGTSAPLGGGAKALPGEGHRKYKASMHEEMRTASEPGVTFTCSFEGCSPEEAPKPSC